MTWYRYVHQVVFVASFMPLMLNLVPTWQGVVIPFLAIIPYAANEIWLTRKKDKAKTIDSPDTPR
ncbi:hypothetical protein ACIPY3_18360 [Paenarthrobacter sp. NPDC089714]|uniref:hypothetical protein n=1 Tax=Paenarthrobacter sp. NPDC089714 TaxID=3364377 RepID=UPI00380A3E2F